MVRVIFLDARNEDDVLFTEYLDVVPRVGESVTYSFEPTDSGDRDSQINVDRQRASSLVNSWTVIDVSHSIRRVGTGGNAAHYAVFVMIAPPNEHPFQADQQPKFEG